MNRQKLEVSILFDSSASKKARNLKKMGPVTA
jgi:hypothetical protein